MKRIRRHYILSGSVQGVGFRYRARHGADLLRVTGWVRNCFDGTVEMEAQGTEEELAELIRIIHQGTWIHITDMKVKEIPLVEKEGGFHIR